MRFFGVKQHKTTTQNGSKTAPVTSGQAHRREPGGEEKDAARTKAAAAVGSRESDSGHQEQRPKKGILRIRSRKNSQSPQLKTVSRDPDYGRSPRGSDHEGPRLSPPRKCNPDRVAASQEAVSDHTRPPPPATNDAKDGAAIKNPMPPSILHKQSHYIGNWQEGPHGPHSPQLPDYTSTLPSPPSSDNSVQSPSSNQPNTRVRFMSSTSSMQSSMSEGGVHLMSGGASVSVASSDVSNGENVFDKVLHMVMAEEQEERNRLNAMGMQYGMSAPDYGGVEHLDLTNGGETSPLSPGSSIDSVDNRGGGMRVQHPSNESSGATDAGFLHSDGNYHDDNDDQLDEEKWKTLNDTAILPIEKLDLDRKPGSNETVGQGHADADQLASGLTSRMNAKMVTNGRQPEADKKKSPTEAAAKSTSCHQQSKIDGVNQNGAANDLFSTPGFPAFQKEPNEEKSQVSPTWVTEWQRGVPTNSQPSADKDSTVIQQDTKERRPAQQSEGENDTGLEFTETPSPDDWVSFGTSGQNPKDDTKKCLAWA